MKGDRDGKSSKRSATRYCLYIVQLVVNDHNNKLCIPVPISFLTQKGHRNINDIGGNGDTYDHSLPTAL